MKHLAQINNIETNFKSEVIAAALTENGLDREKMVLIRQQGNKKGVSKDIDRLRYQAPDHDIMERLYIYTNRESIYDSLPEGIFHQISTTRYANSKEEIIREIREQRNKKDTIQKFFQPFEMILDDLLIDVQSYEQKYNKIHFYKNLTRVIDEHWDILQHLSTGQALQFIKAIPILPEASRNMELTADIISMILDSPVNIKENTISDLKLEFGKCEKLSNWQLGINSVLGNTVQYHTPSLLILIGPVSLERMKLFESNQKNDLILKELINLLIPFNRNVISKVQITKSESKFRLSGGGHTTYLGINTTL